MSSTGSEIAGAEALPLSGLVNYQEGSVVSRVILKRDEGNVTVFAFDEGQGLNASLLSAAISEPRIYETQYCRQAPVAFDA